MIITKKLILMGKVDFYTTNDQKLNYKMRFQNFKTNSYSVGQKHYSGTKNIAGETTFN